MSGSQMILSLVIVAAIVVGVGRSATPTAAASATAKPARTAQPGKAVVLFSYQDDWWCVIDAWTLEDKKGDHAPHDQVVRWMLQNNKHPGVAYLDILAEEG
ncbi:MAG: hypothetical protein GY850_08250, partial [bacterium]|nr:hypothetical protein [bacterium]